MSQKTNKPLVVMMALMRGVDVQLGDWKYRMVRAGADFDTPTDSYTAHQDAVGIVTTSYSFEGGVKGPEREVMTFPDFTLNQFIEKANELTDDEVFLIGAQAGIKGFDFKKRTPGMGM